MLRRCWPIALAALSGWFHGTDTLRNMSSERCHVLLRSVVVCTGRLLGHGRVWRRPAPRPKSWCDPGLGSVVPGAVPPGDHFTCAGSEGAGSWVGSCNWWRAGHSFCCSLLVPIVRGNAGKALLTFHGTTTRCFCWLSRHYRSFLSDKSDPGSSVFHFGQSCCCYCCCCCCCRRCCRCRRCCCTGAALLAPWHLASTAHLSAFRSVKVAC